MPDVADLRRRDRMALQQIGDALLDRLRRVARGGCHFVIADLSVLLAQQREIRERAPDVDANSIHACYSGLMPASWITLRHLTISLWTRVAKIAGLLATISAP